MEQADEAAQDLGLSRSGLIAEALRQYLWRRRQGRITEQLNGAYDDGGTPAERATVKKLKTKVPTADKW